METCIQNDRSGTGACRGEGIGLHPPVLESACDRRPGLLGGLVGQVRGDVAVDLMQVF
jgi:hypothetical protein